MFLIFEVNHFSICFRPINFTSYFQISSTLTPCPGTPKNFPIDECVLFLPAFFNHFSKSIFIDQQHKRDSSMLKKISVPVTFDSNDSDVFYVEEPSGDQSLPRPNTPNKFNSTEFSGTHIREKITISIVTSPEPIIITIEEDSNEPKRG